MNLGIWTNSEDSTANYLCSKRPFNVNIYRFDSDRKNFFSLEYDSNNVLEYIDVLWYRRPFENSNTPDSLSEKIAFSETEEALWNYLFQIPKEKWINFPTDNWYADKKIRQLRLAEKCGLNIPEWILTNESEQAEKFLKKFEWDCVIKPINCGYFIDKDDVYHIYTNEVKGNIKEFSIIENCPTFFQKRISKAYDVRTIYLNANVLFIGLYNGSLDVRRNEMKNIKYKIIDAPENIKESYIKMMKYEGLKFCTSDFVVDENNKWYFLENNPNGQWVWMDKDLNGKVVEYFFENIWDV
ncbi:MAG: hypothetical protein WC679_13390 [Bacteroidales bacterium]|jgi:glutathione synthase/RimK-type ligase-like ATP-grasp enzyme